MKYTQTKVKFIIIKFSFLKLSMKIEIDSPKILPKRFYLKLQ